MRPTFCLAFSYADIAEAIAFDLLRGDKTHQPVLINAVVRDTDILLAVFGAKQRRLYEAELLRVRRESEEVAEIVRRSSDASFGSPRKV